MRAPSPSVWTAWTVCAAIVVGVLPARIASASPGWSSRPRWRLPSPTRRRCPPREPRCRRDPPDASGRAPTEDPPIRTQEPAPWGLLTWAAPRPAMPAPSPPRARPVPIRPALDATALMDLRPAECRALLRKSRIDTRVVPRAEAPDVQQPVRLTGPIRGVTFTIPWSKGIDRDPHAIWDCRLVAAMIPLADWLGARGVVAVHYFSVLRPGQTARKRRRSQHRKGLAIDMLGFVPRVGGRPGPRSDVEEHYPKGRVRACPAPDFPDSRTDLYGQFVCFATGHGLVHTLLTPDHDHAHRNHLHLDLKAGQTHPADPYVSFAE